VVAMPWTLVSPFLQIKKISRERERERERKERENRRAKWEDHPAVIRLE